jgi:hypothetical protein
MGNVMSGLRIPTQFNYGPISKILNMQIKLAMYELFCEVMHDVLDGLSSELQNTEKTSWKTAFPAILILGIIVEDLEVAFDSMILNNILNNHGCKNRIERVRYCQTLDDLLMGQWRSNSKKFNSIRDDLDKPTLMLIDVLESLGTAHNIEGQADRPLTRKASLGSSSPLDDHLDFRLKNSGRLVAMFLDQFLRQLKREAIVGL